ncbi:F-box protein At1g47056-like [Cynara cardunculus var. scolymus]|uniref:F-box protein At1g47056-like n=1 Tax=Cynara cardunculus var. scolymus TaxID=59895 RepID=UPI000D62B492|nr:F-box protein At1g47056-like [Cynara cardunculus var. scolymus]
MGQSSSSLSPSPPGSTHHLHRSVVLSSSSSSAGSEALAFRNSKEEVSIEFSEDNSSYIDYTSEIPDDCLAVVFQFLGAGDRKRCSLVSRRWLLVEGQSRHRLALNAQSELQPVIPSIFSRFDSVTKLSLRCDRRSVSIDDNGLILISLRCRNLTRLKLRGCREISDIGMAALAKNCKELKKFSCGSCMFGAKGMNALLDNCSSLEELSVKRLRGINDGGAAEPIGPGAAAMSLKSVCLKELYNGQFFGPLISGAKKLKTLKLLRCLGDWDRLLETVATSDNCLSEVHLERLQVSDIGLSALSNCSNLEILHIVKTPECTNTGVIAIAGHCKFLRKLHIDGWKTNRIGNEALIAIAKHSANLQELVLIGVNPSSISLEAIAINCQKLERLALCGSETIADGEISCIASKCVALKKLCIKGCPVSDEGIEAFAWGCPNLVKIKVKKCRNVTFEVGDWLRARRGSLVVNLDACAVETETVDASASDSGAPEDPVGFPPMMSHAAVAQPDHLASSSSSRASVFKSRFGLFGGRGLVTCTLRRWSNGNSSSNGTS